MSECPKHIRGYVEWKRERDEETNRRWNEAIEQVNRASNLMQSGVNAMNCGCGWVPDRGELSGDRWTYCQYHLAQALSAECGRQP